MGRLLVSTFDDASAALMQRSASALTCVVHETKTRSSIPCASSLVLAASVMEAA